MIYNIVVTSLAFALFALVHSVLANRHLKQRVFSRWPSVKSYYRLTYTVISVITLGAWYIYAPFPEGMLYHIQAPWNIIFIGLQCVGLAGFILAMRPIDISHFLGTKQLQDEGLILPAGDQLITRGLYRWVRHPLYSSCMIILLCNPYMSYKWALIALLFGLYFWIGSIYEERNLMARYGTAYREYQQRVPRFIPKFPLF